MKVAIIDISKQSHHTYMECLNRIFCKDYRKLYLSEFLNKRLKKSLEEEYFKIDEIVEINKNSFIKAFKIAKEINQSNIELVFINTLQNDWLFYFILVYFLDKKILLSIHNINRFYKKSKLGKNILKNIKRIIKNKIKCFILSKSSYINVYGVNLKNYLRNLGEQKIITNLPFSCFLGENKIINSENTRDKEKKLKIVIPGGFSLKRRDYEMVYNVFKKLQNEEIELSLLGYLTDVESEFCFEKFKKLKKVKTYDSFVTEKEFNLKMKEADIILGPTQKIIGSINETKEIYGLTKETGFTFSQITYGKSGITPDYIKKFKELETSTLSYKNEEELYQIILKLKNNSKLLNELKNNAIENSEKFKPEKLRKIFKETINK